MKYIVFLLFFISINAFAGVEDDEMAVTNYIRCELIFNKKKTMLHLFTIGI